MKTVPRENGAKPPIAAIIGSVIAIISRGTRYACQPLRFAPANRLIAPTGARLGGCGRTRSNPPIAVRLNAGHLEGNPSSAFIVFILSYFTLFASAMPTLPDWAPTTLPARRAGWLPNGSRQRTHR